jgi:Trypsin-like peptidase domain
MNRPVTQGGAAMDLIQRVVDVWTGSSFGSGFLLTNRLVLTARHVVQPHREIVIRPLASEDKIRCQVIWVGRDTDTALLEILGHLPPDLQDMRSAGLGRPIGTSRPLACSAIGFPWCQQRPDGRRDTEHLRGEIQLGTAALDDRYQVSVQSGIPHRPKDSSAWAGMSGSALLADDLVVGVITEDTPNFTGGRLTAVPAVNMVKDDGFVACPARK